MVDVGFSHLARPHSFILVRINTEGGPSGIGDSAMIHGDGAKAAADGRVIALAEDRRTRTRRNGE